MAPKLSRNLQSQDKKTPLSKVTRNGQITIPARFRQNNAIRVGSSVEITDEGQKLIIEAVPLLLDELGSDKGKYDSAKLKKMLDESRKNWR